MYVNNYVFLIALLHVSMFIHNLRESLIRYVKLLAQEVYI